MTTWADKPEPRDPLTIAVREGRQLLSNSYINGVGVGSREHDLRTDFTMTILIITSITGSSVDRVRAGNTETVWESNAWIEFVNMPVNNLSRSEEC